MSFRQSFSLLALLAALAGTLTSCKENTVFGTSVLPTGDSLNTLTLPDTLTVQARSIYDDSALTNFPRLRAGAYQGTRYFTAGVVNTDPYFGKTVATFAFEPAVSATNFTFGTNPQIDSMVLVLPYSGYSWGDTASAPGLSLRVYQMGAPITDSFLYSSRNPDIDRSRLFGETTIYHRDLRDSVWVSGVRRAPHVRIPLNRNTFLPVLQSALTADTLVSAFVTAFKGLCVEPDASRPGSFLPYFVYNGGTDIYQRPGVVVYYQNASADSLSSAFSFGQTVSDGYTAIRRDYAGTPAYNALFGSQPDGNVLLVQNAPGAAIDFQMPHVRNLPRAVYNRAQLILTAIDTARNVQFSLPRQLVPMRINADGSRQVIADRLPEQSAESEAFVDGTLRKNTIGGTTVYQYIINFPRELQQAVVGQRERLHLRIGGTWDLPGAFALIAGGRSHPAWKMQVVISYSKI